MNDAGEIVGMVDVLKLTYATLEQINTMSTNDNEGPAWQQFFASLDHETESMASGEGSHHHTHQGRSLMSPDLTRERITDSVAPGDSASHVGADSPPHSAVAAPMTPEASPADVPFLFKFKAPNGQGHTLRVTAAHGVVAFVAEVTAKLGGAVDAIGGAPDVEDGKINGKSGYALSYLDDEGDPVSITTDQDLLEAILLARERHLTKVEFFVHHPEKPPTRPAPEPAAATVVPTPSASSGLRERRRPASEDDDGEDEDADEVSPSRRPSRRPRTGTAAGSVAQEQVIAGVPNELLLPGAIAGLAVVIIAVFAFSRMSSNR
jgi:hypothetical protein